MKQLTSPRAKISELVLVIILFTAGWEGKFHKKFPSVSTFEITSPTNGVTTSPLTLSIDWPAIEDVDETCDKTNKSSFGAMRSSLTELEPFPPKVLTQLTVPLELNFATYPSNRRPATEAV